MLTTVRVAAFIFTIIGIFPILSFAQIGFKPEILFGAQGLALGRSALITAHDALAVSLNPAGVTALQRVTASVAFGRMPANDDAHTSMGLVIPTRRFGHFGVSFFQTYIRFTRRDDTGQELEKVADRQRYLFFTYGKSFSTAFAVGVNIRFWEYYFKQHKTRFHGGVEYFYQSTIALRAGVYDENFSVGADLQFKDTA